jgi:hypothetical protein
MLSPLPLFSGTAAVIPADLIHLAIELDPVAIRVAKLDGLIHSRTFLIRSDDIYPLRPQFRGLLS